MNSGDPLTVLSDDQRNVLKEFRDSVQDILQPHHHDYFLLRWLRARNFDIEKSENMIRESFKFRKKLNMDEMSLDKYVEPEVHKLYHVTARLGFDKEGCLVRYIMGGIMDIRGMLYSISAVELIKVVIYYLDCDAKVLEENNKQTGRHEARNLFIADCREFNPRQYYDKQVFYTALQLLRLYQDNYPEILKVVYIVNVPSYFFWLWNIFKPFIDSLTLSKIKIYKTGNESWKEELLSMVDPEIIPAFLGGSLCDPDGNPTCQTIVRWTDKKIPTSYYSKMKGALRADDPDVKSVMIRARSCFELKIPIKIPRSILKWEFQTKSYNIRFGVFYEKMEYERLSNVLPDEFIAVENVECHVVPETGHLLCEEVGNYILLFDNSYSWFTPKHLLYKVTSEKPEEINAEISN